MTDVKGENAIHPGHFLDALTDAVALDNDADEAEINDALRAEGIDPDAAIEAVRMRLHQLTWLERGKARARRQSLHRRPPRPTNTDRKQLELRYRRLAKSSDAPLAVGFRKMDSMSDEQLWNLICDLEDVAGD